MNLWLLKPGHKIRTHEGAEAEAERLRAARDNLVSFYDPVHAEWYEDPDALMPDEYLSISATPEEVRQAYRRFGARFELDGGGALTLRLELDLGGALHVDSTY
jgi:hypothetical protein